MEYAVRGPLVIRAGEIEKELKQVSGYPGLSNWWLKLTNNNNYLLLIANGE